MSKQIIFRLTEGRTPASWSLKGGSAIKPGLGQKHIGYFKGSDSIFVEDNKDDREMEEVVFEYNDELTDPATQIIVEESDVNLVTYLKSHAFFNVHYKIHSTDAVSEAKLEDFEKTEKALEYIKVDDEVKIKAIAVAVFKNNASGWSHTTCKAELKEAAFKNPKVIIGAMEDPNYESKYLAALAFYSDIVAENTLHTAVVWTDGQGEILKLALGENGIEKLGNLLSIESEESKVLLQEIGARIEKKDVANMTKTPGSGTPFSGKTEQQIRDEEREKVLAEIEAENAGKKDSTPVVDQAPVETKLEVPTAETSKNVVVFDATDLTQVQAKYKEVLGKEAPVNKKNNIEWLNAEIDKLK